ncbi:unnamed protein product [Diplocarpon coronariae]|uniref:Uncharacterized protein n=1 Tax=Diplocarpon coronariae TaxID=2795749 RepID=A0A218Z5F0_9HELO|nr:hypothetical protein B2J93_91 [Marssonina coronariae]
MQDSYSTQATWGSAASSYSPSELPRPSLSPEPAEAGPSNPAPHNIDPQPHVFHSGGDLPMHEPWGGSGDGEAHEEHSPHSQSSLARSPYSSRNPSYSGPQPPPCAPPAPENDHGGVTEQGPHGRPAHPAQPHQQYLLRRFAADEDHHGPWSAALPGSAEQRREILAEGIPGLKRPAEYEDKLEEDLSKMTREEQERRKRAKKAKGKVALTDVTVRGRDGNPDCDRRGGRRGQAVWAA